MVKRIVSALLITGVIVAAPAAADAAEGGKAAAAERHQSIVGSWMATLDNGERLLFSFASDGIELSTVQSEVSLSQPVLTPGHGAWTHIGSRQFATTDVVILYDIQTGEYQGFGKLRALLTLDKAGDRMDGTATVEIFGTDGSLLTKRASRPLVSCAGFENQGGQAEPASRPARGVIHSPFAAVLHVRTADGAVVHDVGRCHTGTAVEVVSLSVEHDCAGRFRVPARSSRDPQYHAYREFAGACVRTGRECDGSPRRQHVAPAGHEHIVGRRVEPGR
jgi:hypothetical protein